MFGRNIKLIFSRNILMLFCGVATSLLSARALGAAGRGDFAVIVLYPNVCAMLVACGLPQAHRYWVARQPERISSLFSNAIIFTLLAGALALLLAQSVVPHVVGERSPEVIHLVRLYLLTIPGALLFDLMIGLLEGARRFGWSAAVRLSFFGVQAIGFVLLWIGERLTVRSATLTMMCGACVSTLLSLFAVWRALHPCWRPSLASLRETLRYGARTQPGVVTEFTTLRLDQLVLGAAATSSVVGLYVVAVRLAEIVAVMTSSVADALLPEVAAADRPGASSQLLTRSLRLTLYAQLILIVPLLIAAPTLLQVLYGAEFAAAGGTFRLLLVASVVWSMGAIAVSGLNGSGHPGLGTLARLAAAMVTAGLLLVLLPTWGIVGAATASLLGYGVMLAVALFFLLRTRQISLRDCVCPRREDFRLLKVKSFFGSPFKQHGSVET